MDLQVPIRIVDELSESLIHSSGSLDLASGEIRGVEYQDYDLKANGLPAEHEDYEFTCGTLSNDGKDVEFRVEVDIFTGKYSVSANELLEIKVRAAKLFAGIDGKALAASGSREGKALAASGSREGKALAAGGSREGKPLAASGSRDTKAKTPSPAAAGSPRKKLH